MKEELDSLTASALIVRDQINVLYEIVAEIDSERRQGGDWHSLITDAIAGAIAVSLNQRGLLDRLYELKDEMDADYEWAGLQ